MSRHDNSSRGGGPNPAIERLREQARERVHRSSLTAVARAAEMSTDSLRRFLEDDAIGVKPERKLSRWLRITEAIADERAAQCVAAMMAVVADLPDRAKMKAIREMLEGLRSQFKHGVGAVPLWLDHILESAEADFLDQSSPGEIPMTYDGSTGTTKRPDPPALVARKALADRLRPHVTRWVEVRGVQAVAERAELKADSIRAFIDRAVTPQPGALDAFEEMMRNEEWRSISGEINTSKEN